MSFSPVSVKGRVYIVGGQGGELPVVRLELAEAGGGQHLQGQGGGTVWAGEGRQDRGREPEAYLP